MHSYFLTDVLQPEERRYDTKRSASCADPLSTCGMQRVERQKEGQVKACEVTRSTLPLSLSVFPSLASNRSIGPLLTEIVQVKENQSFVTETESNWGKSRQRGGKCMTLQKGFAPLQFNLQLVLDKSVSSLAVGRGGWGFGGHNKLTPYFSALLNH